jgi:alkylation response protein AidB-like acyl-CoA dehydrogenase
VRDAVGLRDDERQVRDLARALARDRIAPLAAQVDETEAYPAEQLRLLGQQGLMGLYVPEAYGGAGLGALAFCLSVEEVAWACASTAVVYLVQYAAGYPIVSHGTEEQKRRYLPRLAAGEMTTALSISEPGAGSDAAGMTTTAVRRGDRYLLNGTKMWVTNGSRASVLTLFATVDRGRGHKGVTAFLVEPTFPGFALGKLERKMGIRGSPTVALHLTDCEVPVENRLGGEGEGFRVALGALDRSRPAVGAQAVGIAQAALDASLAYARERHQFGQPIAAFQGIQFMLADMAMQVHASRLMVRHAAALVDRGVGATAFESSMAKCFAGDAAMKVTTDAVQVFGGYGYTRDFPVERYMREAKVMQIFEGTNQIQRMVIGRALDTDEPGGISTG